MSLYAADMVSAPSYEGSGLVNLMAEVETRLTGSAPWSGLDEGLAASFPESQTYVILLFDGLGMAQLEHPDARGLRSSLVAALDAPFPTTTSVSLSTIATGLPPSRHGQVSHLTWMEDVGEVVNSLKWVTLAGEQVPYDHASVLEPPNLWERLRMAGVEPITVQPGDFSDSPLSRVLYRGARFEGVWGTEDLVAATAQMAAVPDRLIFAYFPLVDVAGHVYGLGASEFTYAMRAAVDVWERLTAALPVGATLLGTADHGLVEFSERDKLIVRDRRFDRLRLAGDTRGVHLWADTETSRAFAERTGGDLVDPLPLLGPSPTAKTRARVGDRLLLAPADKAVIPKGFDKRLRCYHGGLTPDEVKIPLLVG